VRIKICGQVAEWSKALAWKVSNTLKGVRGFDKIAKRFWTLLRSGNGPERSGGRAAVSAASNPTRSGEKVYGQVAEWSKALAWKVSNTLKGVRGFESHPVRQY
jgi:hypothetical protein